MLSPFDFIFHPFTKLFKGHSWNLYRKLTLFLGQLAGLCLLNLGNASHRFRAQQTASPVTTDFVVAFVVVGLDGLDDLSEVGAVRVVNVLQCDDCAGLAVYQLSQARLALDDAVWNAHFTAQCWEEEDQLEEIKKVLKIS